MIWGLCVLALLCIVLEFRRSWSLRERLEYCARRHGDVAQQYERAGNAGGAAELRRVENLLWTLRRGERWSTVLPEE